MRAAVVFESIDCRVQSRRVDLSALTAGRRDGTSFAQFLAPYGVAITGVSLA